MFIFSMIIIFIVGIISSVVSMVVVVMQVRLAVYGNARGGHSCSASTVNRSSGESPWFGVRTGSKQKSDYHYHYYSGRFQFRQKEACGLRL